MRVLITIFFSLCFRFFALESKAWITHNSRIPLSLWTAVYLKFCQFHSFFHKTKFIHQVHTYDLYPINFTYTTIHTSQLEHLFIIFVKLDTSS